MKLLQPAKGFHMGAEWALRAAKRARYGAFVGGSDVEPFEVSSKSSSSRVTRT
jgi:hypothetical protein